MKPPQLNWVTLRGGPLDGVQTPVWSDQSQNTFADYDSNSQINHKRQHIYTKYQKLVWRYGGTIEDEENPQFWNELLS